ncbi:MAG: phospholipase D family protein [Alphaproteobacteria bacterium]|nr:phospholipase D family protein [Alphaproteobacteria bacterium]
MKNLVILFKAVYNSAQKELLVLLSAKLYWCLLALPLVGCATVPTSVNDNRLNGYSPKITPSDFDYDPMTTPIAKCYATELSRGENVSGATLIDDGTSAFVVRAAFARMATKTIDLQTYIYSNDLTSKVLIGELKNAADRGVKVRILLDDYGTKSDVADVMLLNQHPNIEVKVFNTVRRRSKLLFMPQLFMDFNRLNSRMHNKLFIVDNIAYITGGRNIGSNYFMPETSANFSDTDVLFIGPMTRDATKSFNEYWNHKLSIPASVFPKAKSKHAIKKLERKFAEIENKSAEDARLYNTAILMTQRAFNQKKIGFSWGRGLFLADPPSKVEMTMREKEEYRGEIVKKLQDLWAQTRESIYVSAAYFVPGVNGLEYMLNEEKSGTHVTIVTNSLSSTNAASVYAKWEKYRKKLLASGADIYEFMLSAENLRAKKYGRARQAPVFSVLHSKSIVFDDRISWIGSFNLDPRSAYFNTENVAIFESADFARKLRDMIIEDTKTSWHLTLDDNGDIQWTGQRQFDTTPHTYSHSPDTSLFRRIWKNICKLMPEKFV